MKIIIGITLLMIFHLGYLDVYSQKEYSNWYFGKQAGITFNTESGEPTFLMGNALIQYEGCASISDYAGNLILYTNGENVFNSQNEQINNLGDFLKGHQSSTQSAVIVKLPNSSSIFYVFTSDAGEYVDPPNEGINYTIIDMNRLGGRGEVTSLNIPLLSKASEKLTTTLHANGRDIWVLSKAYNSNNLYAWLLTENGISDPVITSLGYTPNSKNEAIGYMKVNSKGNAVAMVYNEKPFFELMKFDNKTGVFSNLIQIPVDDYYSLYGVEFSPNGNYLYLSNSGSMLDFYTIFQFDIRSFNVNTIANSRVLVDKDNGSVGSLQVGPNNRIYIAVINKSYLMGIIDPDRKCPQCSFTNNAIELADSISYMGLPQSVPKYSYSKNILACEFLTAQLDPEDFLDDTSTYEFTYQWTGPNGFSSKDPKPIINPVLAGDSGIYTLNINYLVNGENISVSFSNRLIVNKKNEFSILGSNILCQGDEIVLQPDTANPSFSYLWSDGTRSRTLRVSAPGIYKLYITSNFVCVDSAEINIIEIPKPKSEIVGSKLICNNEPVVLSSKYQSDTLSYRWSTGERTPSISVDSIGLYQLIVSNQYGCSDTNEINVVHYDNIVLKISGDSVICNPNPARLFADISPYDSTLKYEYLWSDGQQDSSILINKPGKIGLTVTIEGVCFYFADITVLKTDPPKVDLNLPDSTIFCNGDIVNLEVINPLPDIKYYWSNGEEGPSISPTESGVYTVFATNEYGCISQKSAYILVKDIVILSIQTYYFTNNCNTDSIAISVYPKKNKSTYTWSNGMVGDSIIVTKQGKYYVIVKDEDGCISSESVEIFLGSGINASIIGESSACSGDTITLTAIINGSTPISYNWSTGDTTETIKVTKSGEYSVKIIDINNCEATRSKQITFYDIPNADLNYKNKIDLCEGDSIELKPIEINPNYQYSWNDGNNKPQRIITKNGKYKLLVSNGNQCFDSSEVEINFHSLVELEIISNKDPIICEGAELELSVDLIDGITYKWSDGSTTNKIKVNQAGNYYLLYENQYGCNDSINFIVQSGKSKDFLIIADKIEFCTGDSVLLEVSEDFSSYLWSNGQKNKYIIVKKGGDYSVEVTDEHNCKSQKNIKIIEFDSELSIDILGKRDFESCEKSYQDSLILVNNSEVDYIINNVLADSNFEITNLAEIIGEIKSKENKVIYFRISNANIANNSYLIRFYSDKPCNSNIEFEIHYKMRAETEIKLDTLTLESGSITCIPVIYNKICPNDYIINSGFEFTIQIPAEYFNPETLSNGTIISKEYIDGYWKLTIRIDNWKEVENDSLLLKICGSNLIGSNIKKEIIITDFKWNDDNILVTSRNNGIISSIACAINIRAIKYFKPTTIEATPNPVNEKVELVISTSSIGEHKIKIYNSNSDLIEEKIFIYEENQPIIQRILLNSHQWQNGIYFIVLESPWGVINSKKIIVVK